ncbi:Hypothetical_protein [Hexamita inflata]|uniref:Hypothetical_protein n=1 Tax=Hexamita inflata TaxID=28002 RepID=A0AA86U021_9EUKA|nr:Hypothetical protein HINF_LOCUS22694 [Hexamita inflata]
MKNMYNFEQRSKKIPQPSKSITYTAEPGFHCSSTVFTNPLDAKDDYNLYGRDFVSNAYTCQSKLISAEFQPICDPSFDFLMSQFKLMQQNPAQLQQQSLNTEPIQDVIRPTNLDVQPCTTTEYDSTNTYIPRCKREPVSLQPKFNYETQRDTFKSRLQLKQEPRIPVQNTEVQVQDEEIPKLKQKIQELENQLSQTNHVIGIEAVKQCLEMNKVLTELIAKGNFQNPSENKSVYRMEQPDNISNLQLKTVSRPESRQSDFAEIFTVLPEKIQVIPTQPYKNELTNSDPVKEPEIVQKEQTNVFEKQAETEIPQLYNIEYQSTDTFQSPVHRQEKPWRASISESKSDQSKIPVLEEEVFPAQSIKTYDTAAYEEKYKEVEEPNLEKEIQNELTKISLEIKPKPRMSVTSSEQTKDLIPLKEKEAPARQSITNRELTTLPVAKQSETFTLSGDNESFDIPQLQPLQLAASISTTDLLKLKDPEYSPTKLKNLKEQVPEPPSITEQSVVEMPIIPDTQKVIQKQPVMEEVSVEQMLRSSTQRNPKVSVKTSDSSEGLKVPKPKKIKKKTKTHEEVPEPRSKSISEVDEPFSSANNAVKETKSPITSQGQIFSPMKGSKVFDVQDKSQSGFDFESSGIRDSLFEQKKPKKNTKQMIQWAVDDDDL